MAIAATAGKAGVSSSGDVRPVALAKNIVTDPGIIYTSADAMMFATTNVIGFVACLGAVGVAATLKVVDAVQPQFLKRMPEMAKVAFDDRTPLRAGGMALLVVGGAAFAGGVLLPAAASFFLAVANFSIAESITRQEHVNPKKAEAAEKKTEKPSISATLFRRPDLYLNIGFACAGLMAGGAALFVLPLVGAAFCMGVTNVMQGRPEHAGHPKMLTSLAAVTFAGIGFVNGHGLIAAAHLINGLVIAEFERRITPGGSMLQVLKETLGTLASFAEFGRQGRTLKPVLQPVLVPVPVPVPDSGPGPLDNAASMEDFNNAAEQKATGSSPKSDPVRKKRNLRDFSA